MNYEYYPKRKVLMKRLLMIILALAALTSLVGCEDGGGSGYTLVGTVMEINDGYIIIETHESANYRVNLNSDTVYKNDGASADKSALTVGKAVTVAYNGMTTRSIPPQINAQTIEISEKSESYAMRARVLSVADGMLMVEATDAEYADGEYVVHVSEKTVILSESGERISLSDISENESVKIVYGGQVTLSLPPQIYAEQIQVN